MSSFHRFWLCEIWSYCRQDIGLSIGSMTFFLKKFIPSNLWQISLSPFCGGWSRPQTLSWFSQIAPILAQSIQCFALSWSKNNLFKLKKVKLLIEVLVFCWYLIRFSFDFGPWTIVLNAKIWPMRQSKIQLDWMVGSKIQFFDHTRLGFWS